MDLFSSHMTATIHQKSTEGKKLAGSTGIHTSETITTKSLQCYIIKCDKQAILSNLIFWEAPSTEKKLCYCYVTWMLNICKLFISINIQAWTEMECTLTHKAGCHCDIFIVFQWDALCWQLVIVPVYHT